jgi:transcriptional regulator with XRE-family HTH domain
MRFASTKTQPKRFTTIRAALEAQGLTQREFARLIDCSEPYVSNLLAGKFRPSLPVADRIQRVLNVDLGAILSLASK